ncbi:hypothetical protein BD769DRAFT_134320 [Suillus cothurnatus]|nr:hypothetical protein BD769DRAFT_134320 [Suillus cothurnatus]
MPECNLCDRYFVDNNALRMHNESKHEIECNYCDRTFSTPDGRDQHERMKHNCCNICNREFGSRESLDQHTEAKHSEYECRYCDKGFASDGARLQHQNAKHAPPPSAFSYLFSQPYVQAAKPAPMEQPDVNAVLGALSAQEFTPERDGKDVLMTQSLNVQATAPQPVADLTCGTCGEPFATIFALEAHKSQHRPGSYACTICERADKPCNCVIRKGISSLTGLVNDKPLDRVVSDSRCIENTLMT